MNFIEANWHKLLYGGRLAVPYVSTLLILALIWLFVCPKAYDKISMAFCLVLSAITWTCHTMAECLRKDISQLNIKKAIDLLNFHEITLDRVEAKLDNLGKVKKDD
jgi:hypothetical protein